MDSSRRHFEDKLSSPTGSYKPIRRIIAPIDHNQERAKGILRVVAETVICKPRIERIDLSCKIKPEDLADFVGPKNFLQRHKGVQQRLYMTKIRVQLDTEREKRKFHQPSIDVVTTKGLVRFTKDMADQLKYQTTHQNPIDQRSYSVAPVMRGLFSPKQEVAYLDKWEKTKAGQLGYESN